MELKKKSAVIEPTKLRRCMIDFWGATLIMSEYTKLLFPWVNRSGSLNRNNNNSIYYGAQDFTSDQVGGYECLPPVTIARMLFGKDSLLYVQVKLRNAIMSHSSFIQPLITL